MNKWTIGLAVCATVAVCSTSASAASADDKGRSCFYNRNVSSWAAAGRDKVNLRVNVNDYYQLQLLGNCPDVDWTQVIGLESRGSDFICSGLDVTLIVPRTTIGPQRCAATGLHKLTKAEVDALPKREKP